MPLPSFLLAVLLLFSPATDPPEAWQGAWEGELALPRRPIVMTLTFTGDAELRASGEMFLGKADATALRISGDEIVFNLQLGDNAFTFTGKREGDRIAGTVRVGGSEAPFTLRRLPELAKPRDRVEAWQQDLDAAVNRFLAYDRSFSTEARERFRREIAGLRASLAKKTDQEVIVALSRAAALSGNAHTRLYLLRNRTELRRLPIRLHWFNDELYVLRASEEHKRILSARVVAIAGHSPKKVYEAVRPLFAGNESWHRYKSVYYMTSPEILFGLGLVRDMDSIEFAFEANGKRFAETLRPLPLEKSTRPVEAWWDLSPARDFGNLPPLAHVLAGRELPLYLRRPDQHYWSEHLPAQRTLYLQYNRAHNMPSGTAFKDFGAEALGQLENSDSARVIVDLRFNTGGDLGVAHDFFEALKKHPKLQRKGSIVVLTGRATFSAGISAVAQLKEASGTVIVGEPVGDELDIWSEGGNVILPNSRLTMHYANAFHSYSRKEYPERKPYFKDMSVESLAPDMRVEVSAQDYFAGRDPMLDAALKLPLK